MHEDAPPAFRRRSERRSERCRSGVGAKSELSATKCAASEQQHQFPFLRAGDRVSKLRSSLR